MVILYGPACSAHSFYPLRNNEDIIGTMGFPLWTLWGMGISAIAALIALGLALLGQSPQFLRRSGLSGARLDMRVRTFTAFAFASLLLAFGFFVAGVPIGDQTVGTATAQVSDPTVTPLPFDAQLTSETGEASLGDIQASVTATRATPATGSFDGPPISTAEALQLETDEPDGSATTVVESEPAPQISATPGPSATTTPTSSPAATSTPSPPPTMTPTPSLTPTPVLVETIRVETQGSTVWLKRSPGGQNLVLLHDGDFVIILTGHANQGGVLWSEVSTVDGVSGWLQEEFLLLDE